MKKYLIFIFLIFVLILISIICYSYISKSRENIKSNNNTITTNKSITVTTKEKKEDIMDGIEVNYHASIRMEKEGKIIYFDPFKINISNNDANYIFITHSHYDHYSPEDIKKVMNNKTKFVVTSDLENKIIDLGVSKERILVVYPNEQFELDDLTFSTIPSYNINTTYHKKSWNWVGYNLRLGNYNYYIVGDSDVTNELKKVKCDVIFIPVGGTYTADYNDAALVVNQMKIKYAIPIHYGEVGSLSDAENFVNNLDNNIKGVILKK